MSKRLPTMHEPSAAARLLEVDVEPLSEQRWNKIEQGVFARLDSESAVPRRGTARAVARFGARGWLPRAAALAATLLLAFSVLAVLSLRRAEPTLSRVSTGAIASHLALPGIVLDVSPESAVVVSGNARESQLVVLDRGEIACDVAHRRPGVPLVIQAGEVQVEVVGTQFSVTRLGETARVVVREGAVKVSARGVTTLVRAGESWPPALDHAVAPPAQPAVAPVSAPAPSAMPPPAAPAEESSAPRAPSTASVRRAPKAASRARPAESNSSPSSAPAAPDLQSQFEAAAQLEAKSPARAIQLYQGLENGTSSWAKNALFAHGRLEAARGNRAEARRILRQYLVNSPQGPNSADARLLLGRLE